MSFVYVITIIALLISTLKDYKKTKMALIIARKKLLKILPGFLQMLIMVAVILYVIPDDMIVRYLGRASGFKGTVLGLVFGSVTMMPGFIAFPLGGILVNKGVSYMNVAAFTTTLMLVGVITYPVEKEYLGSKITIIRNVIAFVIAVIITMLIGVFYGEVL